jgi:carboxyl-terminal processing protease
MKPGETRDVEFTFDVLDSLKENLVKVELSVADHDLGVISNEKVAIPVVASGLALKEDKGRAVVNGVAKVRVQPLPQARVVGQLPRGSVLETLGRFGDFAKVSLGGNRFGFIENNVLSPTQTAPTRADFKPELVRSPPVLDVEPAQLATREGHVRIGGIATDADQVLDAFVFVGSRKVFYQSNRKSSDPSKMPFSVDVTLNPGVNVIHVVAREHEDTATRQTLVGRRDGPGGELFGADWEFSGAGEEP